MKKHKMENIKHIMKTIEEPTGSETTATEHANNKSGIKFADGKHALQYRVHINQMGFEELLITARRFCVFSD